MDHHRNNWTLWLVDYRDFDLHNLFALLFQSVKKKENPIVLMNIEILRHQDRGRRINRPSHPMVLVD